MLIHYIVYVLMLFVFAFAGADVWSTDRAIARGATEANPLIAFIMRMIGEKWIIVRLLFALSNIFAVIHYPALADTWKGIAAFGFNIALMTYVIWNNINVYNNQIAK